MIKNPVPEVGLFATPESGQHLEDYIYKFPNEGGMRMTLYTVSGMTRNLCSKHFQGLLDDINERDAKVRKVLEFFHDVALTDSSMQEQAKYAISLMESADEETKDVEE